jgi:hypothetical protein
MLSSHSEGIITTPVVNYDGSFPDNSNSAGNPQTGEPRLFCQFSESIAIPPRNTRGHIQLLIDCNSTHTQVETTVRCFRKDDLVARFRA